MQIEANLGVLLGDATHVKLHHLAALRLPEVCKLVLLNFLLLALNTQSKVLVCFQLLGDTPVCRTVPLAHPALLFLLHICYPSSNTWSGK